MDGEGIEREVHSLKSQELGFPLDPAIARDEQFVSRLSTILVASIQEAKDRISHIEYIFCSQLYPNFQSNSKTLHKFFSQENHRKHNENQLLLQIEELRSENRRISEENRLLKERTPSEHDLVAKRRRIEELERLVQSKGSEIENSEQERKRLLAKIDELDEELAGIRRKTREFEEGEELIKQLRQEMELKRLELLESEKKLGVYEKENKLLVDKVKCFEERIDESSYQKVVKQVESVTCELQDEKKKRISLIDAYKRLKSQHNYLREKVGLTAENMICQNKSQENESDLFKHKSPITAPGLTVENPDTSMDACKTAKVKSEIPEYDFGGLENRTPDVFVAVCDTNKVKEKASEDDKGANLSPPSSSFHGGPKCPSSTKSVSVSGTKRPASSWRQTRSHQSRAGPDPHDDFLDTPLENIRENLKKDLNKENLPDPIQKDISMNSSDDETQDLNAKSSPQKKQTSIPVANKRGFKYIEPVRKKAERENLKGVECKQCRKFYEAVLPNADGKDPDISKQNIRCEHHDGVSRHRYRFHSTDETHYYAWLPLKLTKREKVDYVGESPGALIKMTC